MTAPPPTHVTVSGHRLAVRQLGSGPPVLLLHGIPTNSLLWRKVWPELEGHATVLAVDMLGYGASDKREEPAPSILRNAKLVAELVGELCDQPPLVAGHDIGGGVAQLMALDHPDAVAGLVLVDTIAYDSWPEPSIARLKEPGWEERIREIDLAKGLRKGLAAGLVDESLATPELAGMYAEPFSGRAGRDAYLRAARALRTEHLLDREADVAGIGVPTEVVWGEEDTYQPLRYGQRLAEAIGPASLTVVPGAGHFLPEEAPQAVADVILRALARIGGD